MRVVLCVAEKPSIAKHMMQTLGKIYSKMNSKSKYNPIYATQGVFQNENCKLIITSVTGHIQHMEFEPKYKSW